MKRLVLDIEEYDIPQLLNSCEIDTETGNRVLNSLRSGNCNGIKAVVVKEEYKIADLDQKLQSLKDGLDALTRAGFSLNLLERYLRTKGVSQKTFKLVMGGIKEFFYEIK